MRAITAPTNVAPPHVRTPEAQRAADEARVTWTAIGGPNSDMKSGRSIASQIARTAMTATAALIARNRIVAARNARTNPARNDAVADVTPQNSGAGTYQ